jgi:hypothetical protein
MKGVTLLLAILISSLVLSIGVGVSTLLIEELKFSATAKESLTAFYAADAGIECALYWDFKIGAFDDPASNPIFCNNSSPAFTIDTSVPGAITTKFDILNISGESCAHMEIEKIGAFTTITSLGESECGASASRVVQRGLRVIY